MRACLEARKYILFCLDWIGLVLMCATRLCVLRVTGWGARVARQVKNPRRTYPLGVVATALINWASYSVPVIVGMALMPRTGDWVDGSFSTQAAGMYKWLGVAMTVGAVLSNLGNYQASLGARSPQRALWALPRMRGPPVGVFARAQRRAPARSGRWGAARRTRCQTRCCPPCLRAHGA